MVNKKKRGLPDIDEILQRPWCFYCERDFDDLKILISHQKAKHFKCERCGRRLNTVGGLSVHLQQVHKEGLTTVENALPNRSEPNTEIFGMEGIPEDIMAAHQQRITEVFFKREAERRAVTGNPGPGGQGGEGGGVKRPKIESAEDIKKRLAEHKARKQAEKMGLGDGSGSNSPAGAGSGVRTRNDGNIFFAQTDTYLQLPTNDSPQPGQFFSGSPQPGLNPYQPPPQQQPLQGYPPFAGSPVSGQPYSPAPFAQGYPQQPQGFPPQPPQQQHFSPAQPHTQYPPQQGHFQPSPQQQPQPWPAQRSHQRSPYMSGGPPASAPGMSPGLPSPAPGLPQRPSFNLPNLSKEEMAKMHSGGVGGQNMMMQPPKRNQEHRVGYGGQQAAPAPAPGNGNANGNGAIGDEVDDLINSVTGQGSYGAENQRPEPAPVEPSQAHDSTGMATPESADKGAAAPPADTAPTESEPSHLADATPVSGTKKKSKKEKKPAMPTKMVYPDEVVSPEEKMAKKQKYAFDRNAHEKTEFIQGDISGAVTGEIASETVRDPQD